MSADLISLHLIRNNRTYLYIDYTYTLYIQTQKLNFRDNIFHIPY